MNPTDRDALACEIREYLAEGWAGGQVAKLLAAAADLLAVPHTDGDPRHLAVKALHEKFQCDVGRIALDPLTVEEWPHLTAVKTTGPGLLDWQKLTLGEIVECLAEAGLLVAPKGAGHG